MSLKYIEKLEDGSRGYGYWHNLMPGESPQEDSSNFVYKKGPCLGERKPAWTRENVRLFFAGNGVGTVRVVFTDSHMHIPPIGDCDDIFHTFVSRFRDGEKQLTYEIYRCTRNYSTSKRSDAEVADILGVPVEKVSSLRSAAREQGKDLEAELKAAENRLDNVIALSDIATLDFIEDKDFTNVYRWSSQTVKEKSVIPGAVVGGLVAGAAGAVVGAINQKGKTKTVTTLSASQQFTYNLLFTLLNDNDDIQYMVRYVWDIKTIASIGQSRNITIIMNNIWSIDNIKRNNIGIVTPDEAGKYIEQLVLCSRAGGDFDSFDGRKLVIDDSYKNPYAKSPNSKSQDNAGGCYVATSVYGSYDCPQVWVLRRFRDYNLAKTYRGRVFIKAYYAISPALVKRFGNTKWFNGLCRHPLDCLVKKCLAIGYSDTPYCDKS